MIRKTVVLLLLLGMFFIPILSAMSYPKVDPLSMPK